MPTMKDASWEAWVVMWEMAQELAFSAVLPSNSRPEILDTAVLHDHLWSERRICPGLQILDSVALG